MVQKLKNNDFLFKLLSLAIAIGVWFYVAYVENPDIEVWFNGVTVVYEGDDALAEKGLVRITDDEASTISVKVKGSRNALFALSSHDITAVADLSGITNDSAHSLAVSIKFPSQGLKAVDRNPYNISVKTEKLLTEEKPVELEYEGSAADNVSVESSSLSVTKVTVSGPESIVKNIASCVARLDISKITANRKIPVKLQLKLADGTVTDNHDVVLSDTYTDVTLTVLNTKTVPVKANITNLGDFNIKEIQVSPDKVKVTGTKDALEDLSEVSTEPFEIINSQSKYSAQLVIPKNITTQSEAKAEIEVILQ
ncbi:MAG: hypothetical protein IJT38_02765 [Clostridia bacterium]|nr:hypothetical protein [Clostridia bacterium]